MKSDWLKFARFVLTGMLNTGFGYATYAVLVLTGMPLWLAVSASTGLAVVFNFYSYGRLVFGDTSAHIMPRYIAFYFVLGLANFGLLHLLGALGVGPLLAQAILLPVLALIGFFGMRAFVFTAAAKHTG